MRRMPSAAAVVSMPSGLATRSASARSAAATSSRISPPRKRSAPSRPSSRLASVTVGSAAAEAVAGRTGRGAGALRADAQAALLHPRDRAAAGADLENVHHGDLHRQRLVVAADQRGAGGERLAVVDDAGLGGGAAHVEGDRVLKPERTAERLGADDAGGGTRFQHAHAVVLGLLGLVESAGRLHDQERAAKTVTADVIVDLADITANDRPDIGVGDHGRAALELAILLGQFMRGRDEHAPDGCAPGSPWRAPRGRAWRSS